jgi:protein tyrosine/serine phosphatase
MLLGMIACAPADGAKPIQATVVGIEKYGHAVLDITTADFISHGYGLGDVVRVKFGSFASEMPFYDGYYSNPGSVMLRGLAPEKNIAVCINYGDFAQETGIAIGDTVEISIVQKAGMLAYQELCAMKYSNNRADYSDDATFANFRAVTVGNIGDGKLYRSASPINNAHGRAAYANAFLEAAGVSTVLNLADSDGDIAEYIAAEDFNSEYYRGLYENGKVLALNMNANFYSDSFAASIANGLVFLSQNDAPYSIHCTEGKDRAGFTAMLLEALMGAELQEIVDDYMLSFYNYYGMTQESEPERYEVVLRNNLYAMLYHVTGVNSYEELTQVDLESAATEYLLSAGMTEDSILTLKAKLS